MAEAKKNVVKNAPIEKVKEELLARKLQLEQEMTNLYQEKFSDDQVQDVGDQALSSSMESLRSSLQDTKLDEYNRLIKALEMIEEGTYGICVDCGLHIPEKRLKSFPNATRCLACQEAFEENQVGNY